MNLDFLPLKSYANIVEGNALRLDWESVVPKDKLNYIMGNPPFVGYSLQSPEQKQDILSIYVDEKGKPYKTAGKIDYVSGWYFKAAKLIAATNIRVASNRLRLCGNLCTSVLMFTLILHTEHLFGIARRALRHMSIA